MPVVHSLVHPLTLALMALIIAEVLRRSPQVCGAHVRVPIQGADSPWIGMVPVPLKHRFAMVALLPETAITTSPV